MFCSQQLFGPLPEFISVISVDWYWLKLSWRKIKFMVDSCGGLFLDNLANLNHISLKYTTIEICLKKIDRSLSEMDMLGYFNFLRDMFLLWLIFNILFSLRENSETCEFSFKNIFFLLFILSTLPQRKEKWWDIFIFSSNIFLFPNEKQMLIMNYNRGMSVSIFFG